MSIREPVGVVAIITPFNVPLIKTTRLVANALAVGNTVVHLPSEMAPHLTILMAEIFAEAGFPAGTYNVVTGNGAKIGDDLTSNKDVDFVSFTGSSVVGQHIAEICAKNKTPNTLELEQKSNRCFGRRGPGQGHAARRALDFHVWRSALYRFEPLLCGASHL